MSLFWCCTLAAPLSAQTTARDATQHGNVAGVVSDTSGKAIAGASVSVVGNAASSTTDDRGRFGIAGLGADMQLLRVRAVGYQQRIVQGLTFRPDETVDGSVEMRPIAQLLDTIRVVARSFYESRRGWTTRCSTMSSISAAAGGSAILRARADRCDGERHARQGHREAEIPFIGQSEAGHTGVGCRPCTSTGFNWRTTTCSMSWRPPRSRRWSITAGCPMLPISTAALFTVGLDPLANKSAAANALARGTGLSRRSWLQHFFIHRMRLRSSSSTS